MRKTVLRVTRRVGYVFGSADLVLGSISGNFIEAGGGAVLVVIAFITREKED